MYNNIKNTSHVFSYLHTSSVCKTLSNTCKMASSNESYLSMHPTSLNSTLKLSDGVIMPWFGLGTSKSRGNTASVAVETAIKEGYKMIDTAQRYGNEHEVGIGVKTSKMNRKEIFIVTKQWNHGRDECLTDIHHSLKRLSMEYVDLLLMHSPLGVGRIVETYDAMLQLKDLGLTRSVGVSNFNIHHLEGLRKAGRPMPTVNQIEIHPFQQKTELVNYCNEHKIVVMGYSPLAKAQAMQYKPLVEMAKRYKKTVAQVMIRWSVQKGYITIPKSANPERIVENTDVFDWDISEDDMSTIESFPQTKVAWETEDTPWDG